VIWIAKKREGGRRSILASLVKGGAFFTPSRREVTLFTVWTKGGKGGKKGKGGEQPNEAFHTEVRGGRRRKEDRLILFSAPRKKGVIFLFHVAGRGGEKRKKREPLVSIARIGEVGKGKRGGLHCSEPSCASLTGREEERRVFFFASEGGRKDWRLKARKGSTCHRRRRGGRGGKGGFIGRGTSSRKQKKKGTSYLFSAKSEGGEWGCALNGS